MIKKLPIMFGLILTVSVFVACKKGAGAKSAGGSASSPSNAGLCEATADNQKQYSAANLVGTYEGKTGEAKEAKLTLTATDALSGSFTIDGKQLSVSKLTYSCTMFTMNIKTDAGDFSASPRTINNKMALRFTPAVGKPYTLTRK